GGRVCWRDRWPGAAARRGVSAEALRTQTSSVWPAVRGAAVLVQHAVAGGEHGPGRVLRDLCLQLGTGVAAARAICAGCGCRGVRRAEHGHGRWLDDRRLLVGDSYSGLDRG